MVLFLLRRKHCFFCFSLTTLCLYSEIQVLDTNSRHYVAPPKSRWSSGIYHSRSNKLPYTAGESTPGGVIVSGSHSSNFVTKVWPPLTLKRDPPLGTLIVKSLLTTNIIKQTFPSPTAKKAKEVSLTLLMFGKSMRGRCQPLVRLDPHHSNSLTGDQAEFSTPQLPLCSHTLR